MVCSDRPTTPVTSVSSTSTTPFSSPRSSPSSSPTQSPPPSGGAPSPPPVILSPCAACKILRRRCAEKCVLAPYFPPTDPLRFTIAHRLFGASNIIKLLQELPEFQRADAVSSMVYEANARIRDPVYGCAGTICQLQKQVSELQAELAMTQAELINIQCQKANLVALFCMEMSQSQELPIFHQHEDQDDQPVLCDNPSFSLDDGGFGQAWETFWGHEPVNILQEIED